VDLQPEVVPLTGPLTHAGEDGPAAVLHGDVVDELHDDDRLSHTSTTKEPGFPTLHVGSQEVHHLDPSFEDLGLGFQLREGRRITVDGPAYQGAVLLTQQGATLIHRVSQNVEDPA